MFLSRCRSSSALKNHIKQLKLLCKVNFLSNSSFWKRDGLWEDIDIDTNLYKYFCGDIRRLRQTRDELMKE